ncbi:MAG: SDR family oxidoreductase [Bryobacteraceae bacterium]|nr:SDR family oxidoreductase [Bryobacteraceae bacterium]
MTLTNTRIIIFGAGSSIASALCRKLAESGARLAVVARNTKQLEVLKSDLMSRGAKEVTTYGANLDDTSSHEELLNSIVRDGGIDAAVLAWGVLGDNTAATASASAALEIFQTNLIAPVSLLTVLGNHFEAKGTGQIVVIGSVAGDRGRQSNYVYGTTKGALERFCEGLRNRLAPKSVHVMLVKPGMVDTPMTSHMKKGPLFAKPEQVAADILKGMKSDSDVIYTPFFWRPIMGLIRAIPEQMFKKMKM